MLLLSFAACGNTNSGNEDDATPTPSTDATPAPGEDVTEGGKYMNYDYPYEQYKLPYYGDFKSKNITIISNSNFKYDSTKEDAVYDVYGLTYETKVTTVEEYATSFISMYMANESPDICKFGMPIAMINKGYFAPLEEIIDFDLAIWTDIKSNIETLWFKDHIYTIANYPARWDNTVYYNKALFEEYGVQDPMELYEQGKWDWNAFRDVAMALTIDSDSDGIPEIYGASFDSGMFVYTTGMDYLTLNRDGTVTNNIQSDNIARAINFVTQLRNEDGCHYDGNDGGEAFGQGKVAMLSAGVWLRVKFPELLKTGNVGLVPWPKDPVADKYYVSDSMRSDNIPTNAPNPNASAAYICATRYNRIMTGIEQKEAWAEYKQLPIADQIEKYQYLAWMDEFIFTELYSDKFTPVNEVASMFSFANKWSGDLWFRPLIGEPWATIAAEIAPAIDAHIEDMMEE